MLALWKIVSPCYPSAGKRRLGSNRCVPARLERRGLARAKTTLDMDAGRLVGMLGFRPRPTGSGNAKIGLLTE